MPSHEALGAHEKVRCRVRSQQAGQQDMKEVQERKTRVTSHQTLQEIHHGLGDSGDPKSSETNENMKRHVRGARM